MKIVIRPAEDPLRELDLTDRLISAIAEELWRLYGGNEQLNWLEAERHLERIVGQARLEAAETELSKATAGRTKSAGRTPPRASLAARARRPRGGGDAKARGRGATLAAPGERRSRGGSDVGAGV